MISRKRLLILSAIGLAVVLSGCSFGSKTNTPAARQEAANVAMQAELENLRNENTELRREQVELTSSFSELEQNVEKRAAEQRRFQEMMAGNFDLLEQSVSMSLARQDTGKPTRSAVRAIAVSPALSSQSSQSRSAAAPSHEAASMTYTNSPAGGNDAVNRIAATRAGSTSQPSRVVVPVAGVRSGDRAQQPAFAADRDLEPPQQAIAQQSHPAAKPLYDKGFAAFARQDYPTAVVLFSNFLERYPSDNYSDNAQFWIAESYYRQGRWEDAEDSYRKVLRNYEHRSTLEGYKTPDAIYRIGQTYMKRQKNERAAYYFANVSERFADSSAGRKAQKEMSSIIANTAQASR